MPAKRGGIDIDNHHHQPEESLTEIMMTAHNQNNDGGAAEHLRERKILSPAAALAAISSASSPTATAPPLDKCDGEETMACLSALVESSLSSSGEDDSVNSSISSMEDEDEEQEQPSSGDGDDTNHKNGLPFIALVNNKFQNYSRTSSLLTKKNENELFEAEQEVRGNRCWGSRYLLARIQVDASLFIATLVLGTLTACSLWMTARGGGVEQGWNVDVKRRSSSRTKRRTTHKADTTPHQPASFPVFPAMELLGVSLSATLSNMVLGDAKGVEVEPPYSPTDFQYDTSHGRRSILPYWDKLHLAIEQTQNIVKKDEQQVETNSSSNDGNDLAELWSKFSTWGPCYPRPSSSLSDDVPSHGGSDWVQILQTNTDPTANGRRIVYPTYKKTYPPTTTGTPISLEESLGGLCRPSFLIIGQGKCGTSSLYHYLTGHPRILPAKEKQIDFFRYHKSVPISWYYSHFPTIESFLGRGALMTGEASPGYMPYPSVVEAVVKRLSSNWKPSAAPPDGSNEDGGKQLDAWKAHVRSLPKIIAIVRNPIERAKSSYKYNYVEPAIKKLRAGYGITISRKRIPGKQTDEYYRSNHLFSFEELAYAELEVLKECLKAGGKGENWTYAEFGKGSDTFFFESIQRRNNHTSAAYSSDIPPLIHLDEACYAKAKSKSVLRDQWKQLAVEHPNKFIALPNWPLTQSILGRGVYSLPLEWWYEVFAHAGAEEVKRIHVVCTENLADTPDRSMDDVTKFLGLPKFDYTNVTNVGRYNVGGHRGYDTITKARKVEESKLSPADIFGRPRNLNESSSSGKEDGDPLLSISDELMNELVQFYHPYNERLFHLIGKRCPW